MRGTRRRHRVLPAVGGTTGTPKLIPRRHREYLYNVRACSAASGFDTDTVSRRAADGAQLTLCCPGTIGALLAGGRVITTGRPGEQSFVLIARERVTHTALVPPLALCGSTNSRNGRPTCRACACCRSAAHD